MGGGMELKETTKSEVWTSKARETLMLTLGSGNVIRLRRVSKTALLRNGFIPYALMSIAMGTQGGVKPGGMSAQEAKSFVQFLALYVREASVEPRIITKGKAEAGQVHIDDVSDDDQMEIFMALEYGKKPEEGPRQALETFPKDALGGTDRPNGKKVQPEALDPSRV